MNTVWSSLFQKRFLSVRLVNWLAALMLGVTALGLYKAKIEAAEARERIADLRADIVEHQRAVSVLRAEVAHLERADRLKDLSRTYLQMNPLEAQQEVMLNEALHNLGVAQSPAAIQTAPTDTRPLQTRPTPPKPAPFGLAQVQVQTPAYGVEGADE